MLFRQKTLDAIAQGKVTVAFRRWKRPTVREGGTLKTRVGLLAIDSVKPVLLESVTPRDAKRAGAASHAELLEDLSYLSERQLFRVSFHLAGPDPRIALRERGKLDKVELEALQQKLDRLDKASRRGPWTKRFLQLIKDNPACRAGDLADIEGMVKKDFKTDVRKLKNLGLTQSLAIGYRLSPRGRTYLRWVEPTKG